MFAKALAKLGRCMITASDGPLDNGGGASVSDVEPTAGARIGIAEAAGGVALDAAGAEAAGCGALLCEHAAQVRPKAATTKILATTFMISPAQLREHQHPSPPT